MTLGVFYAITILNLICIIFLVKKLIILKNQVNDEKLKVIEKDTIFVEIKKDYEQKLESMKEGSEISNKKSFITSGTLHDMGNVLNGLNFKIHGLNKLAFSHKFKEIKRAVDLLKEENISQEKKDKTFEFIDLLIDDFTRDKEKSRKLSGDAQRLVKHMIEIIDLRQRRPNEKTQNNDSHEGHMMPEIIHSALLINEYLIQGHSIKVEMEVDELGDININPSILMDVLANLIKNACEAIIYYKNSEKKLLINVSKNSDSVIISITDSGIGMDQTTIEKVFQGNFTTKDYGLGLGLIHSKTQIELLGGTLQATSKGPREGSTFTINFPIKKN